MATDGNRFAQARREILDAPWKAQEKLIAANNKLLEIAERK